jgi:hypothetical protein
MTVEIRVPRPRSGVTDKREARAGRHWPVLWFRAVLRGTDPSLGVVNFEAYYFDGVRA